MLSEGVGSRSGGGLPCSILLDNELPHGGAHLVMRIVGATLVSDRWVIAQFLFCLAGAEQFGGQFVRAHVVEDALALLQSLAQVNVRRRLSGMRPQ
jgi:hypothetical protein